MADLSTTTATAAPAEAKTTETKAPVTAPAPAAAAPATTPAADAKPAAAGADKGDAKTAEAASLLGDVVQSTAKDETKPVDKKTSSVPETYDLKLPEGALLGSDRLEKIAAIARERGFSKEQAQSFVEAADLEVKAHIDGVVAAYKASVEDDSKKLIAAYGDKLPEVNQRVTRVVVDHGGEELLDFLIQTGAAKKPVVVKFLDKIARMSASDTLVKGDGKPTPKARSTAEVLFGDLRKGKAQE